MPRTPVELEVQRVELSQIRETARVEHGDDGSAERDQPLPAKLLHNPVHMDSGESDRIRNVDLGRRKLVADLFSLTHGVQAVRHFAEQMCDTHLGSLAAEPQHPLAKT